MGELRWFGVREVFLHRTASLYEERITLWQTTDFEAAAKLAEEASQAYAATLGDVVRLDFMQLYELAEQPGTGREVFSLMRSSLLPADAYVSKFFDTGGERQQSHSLSAVPETGPRASDTE